MNLESVEKHFEDLNLSTMKPGGQNSFTARDVKANPATVLEKVCKIYQSVRPFIMLASTLFFVPKKWRDALVLYMSSMDTICPGV